MIKIKSSNSLITLTGSTTAPRLFKLQLLEEAAYILVCVCVCVCVRTLVSRFLLTIIQLYLLKPENSGYSLEMSSRYNTQQLICEFCGSLRQTKLSRPMKMLHLQQSLKLIIL